MNLRKTVITALTLCCTLGTCSTALAQSRPQYPQNENCVGLKNPSNFTFTGGAANSEWKGYVGGTGCKQATLSTCTTPGFCTLTPVANASQLESQSSSSCSNSPTSYNIDNVQDNSKRFVLKGSGTDPFTGNNLPYLPPDTSFHTSIRLGNYCWNGEVEMLTYQMNITPDNALVTIWYALSLEYAGHPQGQNPEFSITIEKQVKDALGNNVYDANGNPVWTLAGGDTLCYIKEAPSSSQLSSLQPPYHNYSNQNIYRDWNKVMVNLFGLLYNTVRIKIAAGDCSPQGHYAACYFAGECQPMALRANGCAAGESNEVARIEAPKGATYQWYRSKTGKLVGDARNSDNSYVLIPNETSDVLNVNMEHFVRTDNGQSVTQTTIMCKMTTQMNESYPLVSRIYTDVGNTKPVIVVDSALDCDAGITLRDLSYAPYSPQDSNQVDSSYTHWEFYTSEVPTPQTLVGEYNGGTVHHTFDNPTTGNSLYSVKVRTSAFGRSCWNEKTVKLRVVKRPVPQVMLERNNLCEGDTITINDLTYGSGYHKWFLSTPDTAYNTPMPVIQRRFDTTTTITLLTRSAAHFDADTTGDGIPENVYCYSDTTFTVFVEEYPKLTVSGDTIVCNGDQSDVHVSCNNVQNCTFNWYQMLNGNTPVIENNDNLVTTISQDRRYYVKVTSPFGCVSWDSIDLYLVKPNLTVDRDKICTGDTATLTAGRAAYFEWTSNPPDPNLFGQVTDTLVRVSPQQTTTYTVVGHGTNGCSATALTQKITVYPYPVMQVQLTPDYIDSENPSVQFADLSENGASSLWDFGGGNTSSVRTVVYTFSDLSQDSILIHLVTANAIGCTNDTSFYVPVGIFAVWFPNAFTPKLETNNVFKPFTANALEDYELQIFDRNGNRVFKTNNIEEGWDGQYQGHDCKQGSYVYIATYRRQGVARLMSQKGTLTLVR